ncbi:hypothetical protein E4T56_gene10533 [Termitomyces sp. T112]|nr:hypothetical protein E4T56_gene10533 [Termitomyces sp. T112]
MILSHFLCHSVADGVVLHYRTCHLRVTCLVAYICSNGHFQPQLFSPIWAQTKALFLVVTHRSRLACLILHIDLQGIDDLIVAHCARSAR